MQSIHRTTAYRLRRESGFTLVELVVVMFIGGLLLLLSLNSFASASSIKPEWVPSHEATVQAIQQAEGRAARELAERQAEEAKNRPPHPGYDLAWVCPEVIRAIREHRSP